MRCYVREWELDNNLDQVAFGFENECTPEIVVSEMFGCFSKIQH